MPPVKSPQRSADTWERRVQASQQEYTDGVSNPRTSWATATQAAAPQYAQGITQSIANQSFQKGVRKAGDQKWQKNTLEKGPSRWADGVRLAKDAWISGFAPYADTIQSTTLPARKAAGDPGNMSRSIQMADALHKKKMQLRGGA